MSAIGEIEISNFQSHKHTIIEPAPAGQLTVIVGPSDSGKTAILRALRWVACNEPRGADFVRVGASKARVSIITANGHKVIRERNRKDLNRYAFIHSDASSDAIYEGIGNSVPPEVQELLGIRPVAIGDMELNLNLAEQLDGPFLGKSVSAPARAKVLGKLAGTEEVDYAAKQLGTDLFRRRQDEKNAAAEILHLEDKLKGYDYLPALKAQIDEVAALVAAVRAADEKKVRLEKLRRALGDIDQALRINAGRIGMLTALLVEAGPIANAVDRSIEYHDHLTGFRLKLIQVNAKFAAAQGTIERTAGIQDAAGVLMETALSIDKRDRLRGLQFKLANVDGTVLVAKAVLGRTVGVPEAEGLAGKIALNSQKRVRLFGLSTALSTADRQLATNEQKLSALATITSADSTAAQAAETAKRLKYLQDRQLSLWSIDSDIQKAAQTVQESNSAIKTLQESYKATLTASGTCPVCGAATKQFRLKEVV